MLEAVASALGLAADARIEPVRDGASGSAWRVTAHDDRWVLRLERSGLLTESRLAAMAAAHAAGLPAPTLVRRAETEDGHAVLLSWLPGAPMLDVLRRDPSSIGRWGRLAGELQRRLHVVTAPAAVLDVHDPRIRPFAAGRGVAGLPSGRSLLHLDWHPGNLLVDESTGRISGVVDWDNARAGHHLLDLARTRSMLEADPGVVALPAPERDLVAAFGAAWATGYGPPAAAVPPGALVWAGRVMLADLGPRYETGPAALDGVRDWIARHTSEGHPGS